MASNSKDTTFQDKDKPSGIRTSNIVAAKGIQAIYFFSMILVLIAVADAIRTSLGPRGMDKMVRYA